MLKVIAKFATAAFASIILCTGALYLWTLIPVSVRSNQPDAGVSYMNTQLTDDVRFTEGYFSTGSDLLHYVEAGQGETIVFLHGFPSFWMSLSHQMKHLKSGYRVIAIDGLGVGKSSVPRAVDAYTLENLSAQVAALLDNKGAYEVHLVGHDWGAAFALGFAQRYPQRVRTVTAMSAPPQTVILDLIVRGSPEADRFAYIEQIKRANPPLLVALRAPEQIYESAYAPLILSGAMNPEEGEIFKQTLRSPKRLHAHINWYRANIPAPDEIDDSSYWPNHGAKVDAPILFIWGQNDPIISDAAVDLIQQLSDDVTLLSFQDTGHWPHFEKRGEVNEAIESFIDAAP